MIEAVTREQMAELIAQLSGAGTAKTPQPVAPSTNNQTYERFDLDGFIAKYGIEVKAIESYKGGRCFILAHCVFNPEHGERTDTAVIEGADGKLGYACQHDSCKDKHWADVREYFEPGYRDRK